MAHNVRLKSNDPNSGEASEISIAFTEDEMGKLQLYLNSVIELHTTRFVKNGSGVNLNFKWDKDVGITWSVKMPHDDDLFGFLHRLRPLILEKEPYNFQKIRKMIERKLKNSIPPILPFLLDLFSGKLMQRQKVMKSNDQIINSEKMLFTWLNAHEYHRDQDKQEFLEELHKIMPLEWSRGVFVNLLIDKAKAIFQLADFVKLILGEQESITIQL
ncbi:hypothetical protein HRM2_p00710 (plasmid) [Desulforapulum autotrophicum HRM2]|uniref:Uncharacterized protein n=1 Tax=Desulforapulum autotrophicum (strain ATCC 43914 / DSM 3382 / VKM B-1955 / HRM2) TaxID=177437 RepID=C0QMS1_DESAH|nr:hypothetical protein [Desulforapulum autotrophicum]ACN18065.1 hypothetical protein HRM2_p00710 [Desulforapulum autotrophicum HRM2]